MLHSLRIQGRKLKVTAMKREGVQETAYCEANVYRDILSPAKL